MTSRYNMGVTSRPNLFTIPPTAPFLETLARSILDRKLITGWPDADQPLSLASGLILLPNRRACRAMRDAFLAVSKGKPLLLPRIAPIGDVDEDEWVFADPDPLGAIGLESLKPRIGERERHLKLAQLVRQWAETLGRAQLSLGADEVLLVGTGLNDALALARQLMQLIDQIETEGVDWSKLDDMVELPLDPYWDISRQFLRLVSELWPAMLAETGCEEPARRRDLLLRAETERLKALPGPVIAAGSTGSILATRDLLKAVCHHPRGALVLPGLDLSLDEEGWEGIALEPEQASSGHPQFGLKRLMVHCGAKRNGVVALATEDEAGRCHLISEAMRPASSSESWFGQITQIKDSALTGIALLEAANEQEEALALALHLRAIAEDPQATAALVTPDRTLARRIKAELMRWDVPYDDSGGQSLAETPAAVLAGLLARLAQPDPAPADLIALLTQPAMQAFLAPWGEGAVAAVDVIGLRGLRPAHGLQGLRQRLADPPEHASQITAEQRESGMGLVEALMALFAPFSAMPAETTLAAMASAHRALFDTIKPAKDLAGLEAILALLTDLSGETGQSFPISAKDYAEAFATLVAGETVRRPGASGARIRILGQAEARLLQADHLVLAGLNEGTWPGDVKLDPWLNRAMRAKLGLEQPERRVGLAAHDFCQLLGSERVLLSRSAKLAGVPTVPSRWLQRLSAVVGEARWAALKQKGEQELCLARQLDAAQQVVSATRPAPRPPVHLRPQRLSVTAVETLIRDPYAIYARAILKLVPLRRFDEPPGGRERGTLIHAAIESFLNQWRPDLKPQEALDILLAAGEAAFRPFAHDPTINTFWRPRFLRMAQWIAQVETGSDRPITVLAERKGEHHWTTAAGRDFTLSAKADRINRRADGKVEVLDYKTGSPPSDQQVMVRFAQQLTLESALIRQGGFADLPQPQSIGKIAYIHLTGTSPAGREAERGTKMDLDQLADDALAGLKSLIDHYENEATPYLSKVSPEKIGQTGDYDHLARVAEWSDGGEGGEDA